EVERDLSVEHRLHDRAAGGAVDGEAETQRIAGVVGEGLEAELPLPRGLGALDREDAASVERRAKQLDVDAALRPGRRRGREHEEKDRGRDRSHAGAHHEFGWKRVTNTTPGNEPPSCISHIGMPPPMPLKFAEPTGAGTTTAPVAALVLASLPSES